MQVSVKHDLKRLKRDLNRMERSVLPQALARTLNRVLYEALTELAETEMDDEDDNALPADDGGDDLGLDAATGADGEPVGGSES